MNTPIDLRSDTVTRPCKKMREAMMNAAVGDDVYGDDPTVNELQRLAAEMLGHESALFLPSGTQSNLVALLTHCQRGDEYVVGADAHTFKYEGGGAAALGGIQPQTVSFNRHGGLNLDDVAAVIKEEDDHFAKTRLLCLENSQHGRVQDVQSMLEARDFARSHRLQLHLDGARMANAAVCLQVELKDIASCFDSVSLCLSKGLGAPVGSLLLGSEMFIDRARRWRKVTGGGMRQAGILAAAGILALTEGVERLKDDHAGAAYLAQKLESMDGLRVRPGWTQTNMVWLDLQHDVAEQLIEFAASQNIWLSARGKSCRLVTHRDVTPDSLDATVRMFQGFFQQI